MKTEIDSRQLNCPGCGCSNTVKIDVRVQQELLNKETEGWYSSRFAFKGLLVLSVESKAGLLGL